MGLTIHYTLRPARDMTVASLKNLLRRMQRSARRNGCAHVGRVLHSAEMDPSAPPFFETAPGCERRMDGGPGTNGWLLEVWPGEGCETAVFGLMEHRRELPRRKGQPQWERRWSRQRRWELHTFCKTQYASERGWEHFRACHLRVIELLDLWREAGGRAKVHDEGCYWRSRSEARLCRELEDYDRLIAAMGGGFKDAFANGEVIAPIFNYRNFERLEHEGRMMLREQARPQ